MKKLLPKDYQDTHSWLNTGTCSPFKSCPNMGRILKDGKNAG